MITCMSKAVDNLTERDYTTISIWADELEESGELSLSQGLRKIVEFQKWPGRHQGLFAWFSVECNHLNSIGVKEFDRIKTKEKKSPIDNPEIAKYFAYFQSLSEAMLVLAEVYGGGS